MANETIWTENENKASQISMHIIVKTTSSPMLMAFISFRFSFRNDLMVFKYTFDIYTCHQSYVHPFNALTYWKKIRKNDEVNTIGNCIHSEIAEIHYRPIFATEPCASGTIGSSIHIYSFIMCTSDVIEIKKFTHI